MNWISYLVRLSSPETLPNLVLCIVGIVGIGVALCSLKTLTAQTEATKKAAEAALLSAQAVINAERAWLDIDFIHVCPPEKSLTLYWMRVINHGKGPAFITEGVLGRAYWKDAIGEIPVGFMGSVVPERILMCNIIPANREPVNIKYFDVSQFPPPGEGGIVTYHGHATYRDIFGNEHRTEIAYRLWPNGLLEHMPGSTHYITTKNVQNPNKDPSKNPGSAHLNLSG